MPLHHVECFKADKLPASKIGEFERQLGGQERGLNRLTVQEYLENVANPIKRNKRAAAIARADFEEKLRHRFQKEFSFMLDPVAAKRKAIEDARNTMSNLAGLHNPDLRAGGRDIVSDFGDRQVNSSIGPQWRPKIDNLKKSSGECAALFARIDFYKC
ncbi:polymorphic toxin type 15 domain-containing protein [Pseudomonas sp. M47T1]|uniref:polymorphic toxin type 15 domain-containing protein n=1 Tax=Pseudomonas sp. M47T1 TaxID=1179778 RepID=UPI003083EADB